MNHRLVLPLVVLLLTPSAAWARYCYNPYCGMCNRLFGCLPGYEHLCQSVFPVEPHGEVFHDATPWVVVNHMLRIAAPKQHDVVYDLGCGDGRFLQRASQMYGCGGVGLELNGRRVQVARQRLQRRGVENVRIVHGDARNYCLCDADIIVVYLFPELLKELLPACTGATRIVSYCHRLPDRECRKFTVDGKYTFYFWERPRAVRRAVRIKEKA